MDIAQRSLISVSWNVFASLAGLAVGFIRAILLARLLPVEAFGVYALAGSVVGLSLAVFNLGLDAAFLHRAPETADENQAATIHFTLKLFVSLIGAILLALGSLVFAQGQVRLALLVLTMTGMGLQLTLTPQMILTRRVVHRRLALLQITSTLLTSLTAVILAFSGAALWALLATDILNFILIVFGLYIWKPVWRPRLGWSLLSVRYFLSFGSRTLLAGLLLRALDELDDLWTGLWLGQTPLGYYTRAYNFATYPRKVIANPVNMVAIGTYSELKEKRLNLSQAFFRTNAFLVRIGFLVSGALALAAPELIRLLIGEKWLPMLTAFRLMLIFTLLDPLRVTVGNLFIAVGYPERVVIARTIQLVVLVGGLFLLGPVLGIAGVALAVDLMLVVGTVILLSQSRQFVDFSPLSLFAVPSLALSVGMLSTWWLVPFLRFNSSDFLMAATKLVLFSSPYIFILLIFERRQLIETVSLFIHSLSHKPTQELLVE